MRQSFLSGPFLQSIERTKKILNQKMNPNLLIGGKEEDLMNLNQRKTMKEIEEEIDPKINLMITC